MGRAPRGRAAKNWLRFASIVIALGTGTVRLPLAAVAQPPAVSGFDVAWFDDFSGSSIDMSKWDVANTNVTTNFSLQDYLPSQVAVSGGNLVISTKEMNSRGRSYVSGLVTSDVRQQYGRWEVRANLPSGPGIWPAIWLLSDTANNPWPSQGEIDIMENRGTEPNLTSSAYHYGTNTPDPYVLNSIAREQKSVAAGNQVNYHNGFHDYAVEWSRDQVRFYVDDVHHATVHDSDTGGFISSQTDGMKLIINTAVGGLFLDDPVPGTLSPTSFEIDHVYAYTESGTEPVLTFDNGSFDENGGSLAQWSTFGNSIGSGTNVRGDNQAVLNGDGSLKLYGQFNGVENFSGVQQGISVVEGDELLAEASAFISSLDSIAGTDNTAVMTIDYFSKQYGLYGSADYLGSDSILLASGSSAEDVWLTQQLSSIAPSGAIEARLGLVFVQPGFSGGAVHFDNVSFTVVPEPSVLSVLTVMATVSAGCRYRRRTRIPRQKGQPMGLEG